MATTTPNHVTFDWEGKDQKGNKIHGQMDGPNPDWIKAQLRRKGTTPLRVRKHRQSAFGGGKKKIKTSDIAVFSRQLSTMLNAGVPLVQAFDIVGHGLENQGMRELVYSIKADVEGGSNLSTALGRYPQYFDALFCNLVQAGEQSGTLDNLLEKIASYKEKSEALKAKIKKAMYYPAAVIIVAFVVTTILLVYVVPVFQNLFQSMGGELPAFTLMVVHLSEFFQKWWIIVFASIGIAGVGSSRSRSAPRRCRTPWTSWR